MEEGCLDKREEEDRTHGSWSGHGASRLKILGFRGGATLKLNQILTIPYPKSCSFAE